MCIFLFKFFGGVCVRVCVFRSLSTNSNSWVIHGLLTHAVFSCSLHFLKLLYCAKVKVDARTMGTEV